MAAQMETRVRFGPQESTHKWRPQCVLGEKSEQRCSGGVSQFVIESGSRSALSPDDHWCQVSSWRRRTSMEKPAIISAHSGHVASVAFAPDGQALVSGGMVNRVQLWTIPAWELLRTPQAREKCIGARFLSPDSQSWISGTAHGEPWVRCVGGWRHLTATGGRWPARAYCGAGSMRCRSVVRNADAGKR